MTVIKQPTRTSCGPACVAMLAGVPINEVLAAVRFVRHRSRGLVVNDSTTVAELQRLLARFGRTLDFTYQPVAADVLPAGQGILKAHRRGARNWHWLVVADGIVYNPADASTTPIAEWFNARVRGRTFFYPVS